MKWKIVWQFLLEFSIFLFTFSFSTSSFDFIVTHFVYFFAKQNQITMNHKPGGDGEGERKREKESMNTKITTKWQHKKSIAEYFARHFDFRQKFGISQCQKVISLLSKFLLFWFICVSLSRIFRQGDLIDMRTLCWTFLSSRLHATMTRNISQSLKQQ